MNSEDFIDGVKKYVIEASVEDVIANLKSPPGRRVRSDERERSDWYNSLSLADREHVNSVIRTVAHDAIFGLLAVVDGVRTIDEQGGAFELAYVGKDRTILNPPDAIGLHDLLNARD